MRTIIILPPSIILFAPVRATFPPCVKIQGMRKTEYSYASHLVHALIQRHKFPHPNYTEHLSLRCPAMPVNFSTEQSLLNFPSRTTHGIYTNINNSDCPARHVSHRYFRVDWLNKSEMVRYPD